MKIAILGAGGFIGSHLVEHLLAGDEHEVVGVDRTDEKLAGVAGAGLTFHRADIRRDPAVLDTVVGAADVVVDLIAHANPSMYVQSPLEVIDVNFLGNLDVVERCVRHGKRLIQYSSAEVYGKFSEPGGLVAEDAPELVYGPVHRQRWIYACAKQLLERIIYAHGAAGDLDYTIVRPFNFLGPRLDYLVPAGTMAGPRVFPHFMSALLTGGPMYLVNGGEQNRAFCHITDAVAAFQLLLDQPDATRHQTYNVGNPDNDITIRALAERMRTLYAALTSSEPQSALVDVDGEAFYGTGYEDGFRAPPDVARMRSLGWTPTRGLDETLSDVMAYYVGVGAREMLTAREMLATR